MKCIPVCWLLMRMRCARILKKNILINTFRVMLANRAAHREVEASCYLLSPSKDSQQGGHRLRPDWEAGKPLSISHGVITSAVMEVRRETG